MTVNIPLIILIVTPMFASAIHINGQFEAMDRIDGNNWYTKFHPSPSLVIKRNAQANGYEDKGDQPSVDLHKGEFCVDVSTYGPTKYDKKPVEVCDSTFVKNCKDRSEQVCEDVTEMECDVVPYTVCQMIMEYTPYRSFEVIQKEVKLKVCTAGTDIVKHTKLMPECRNVTKQNCITKWETDANGKQVWAGNEACEPVTWKECKLVDKQVDFKVPKIKCEDGEDVHYDDFIDVEKNQMTSRMVCEVKHTTSCAPKVSNKCQYIQFQECNEEPIEKCETKTVKIPKQEKEHKKKCLLTHDNELPETTPAPAPYQPPAPRAPAPEPSYPVPSPTYPAPAPTYYTTPPPKPTYQPKPSYQPSPAPSYHQAPRGARFNNQFRGQFRG